MGAVACAALGLWSALAGAQQIPAVEVTTLAGRTVQIPAPALPERTILVLGFKQSHTQDFDAWRPAVSALAAHPDVDWYELPFVDVGRFLRRIIGTAMDKTLTDPTQRAHFAPVWGSAQDTRSALGIGSDKEVVLVVIDRGGQVLWQGAGEPTEARIAAITAAVGP